MFRPRRGQLQGCRPEYVCGKRLTYWQWAALAQHSQHAGFFIQIMLIENFDWNDSMISTNGGKS
jgi:hypothetical protein